MSVNAWSASQAKRSSRLGRGDAAQMLNNVIDDRVGLGEDTGLGEEAVEHA